MMNPPPTTRNIVSMLVLALCMVAIGLVMLHSDRDLPGSGTATLDQQYTEVTSSKYGKSYEVTYSFTVDGKEYRGKDTIYDEPTSAEHDVYYDPKAPDDNSLKKNPVDGKKIIIAIVFLVAAMIAYNTLPIHPFSGQVATGGGIGDAAGEHLTMEPGRYPATFYVGLAFFGQVALIASILWQVLVVATGGRVPADLTLPTSILAGLAITLLIYWDRWKCTTVHCTRYCSGCANISVVYVPIVAFFYANWRGVGKFAGR